MLEFRLFLGVLLSATLSQVSSSGYERFSIGIVGVLSNVTLCPDGKHDYMNATYVCDAEKMEVNPLLQHIRLNEDVYGKPNLYKRNIIIEIQLFDEMESFFEIELTRPFPRETQRINHRMNNSYVIIIHAIHCDTFYYGRYCNVFCNSTSPLIRCTEEGIPMCIFGRTGNHCNGPDGKTITNETITVNSMTIALEQNWTRRESRPAKYIVFILGFSCCLILIQGSFFFWLYRIRGMDLYFYNRETNVDSQWTFREDFINFCKDLPERFMRREHVRIVQ